MALFNYLKRNKIASFFFLNSLQHLTSVTGVVCTNDQRGEKENKLVSHDIRIHMHGLPVFSNSLR